MKKIKSEFKFCIYCMEEHEVDIVEMADTEVFKDEEVIFTGTYQYCPIEDELLETEEMMRANSLAMKDAYRENMNLLTSKQIIKIREKYNVSQKDLSEILDWGRATITRYENHQVQDRGNDNVLRKIDSDPKWFLEMLIESKGQISDKAYDKYYHKANERFKKERDQYLIDSIKALYADYEDSIFTGGVTLNLAKVVERIDYLSSKVKSLHKVKLAIEGNNMLSIDEILKVSNEMGVEIRDSEYGKHYILDDSGKEVGFSTNMLIKLEPEDVSYKLDLKLSDAWDLGRFSSEYNLVKCRETYASSPGRINESVIDAA